MTVQVDVQIAVKDVSHLPTDRQLSQWAQAAIAAVNLSQPAQLTLRVVDEAEITQLNHDYRHKNAATNVLSFPFELPMGLPAAEAQGELGDIVICAAVVQREAAEQGKSEESHWAHMVIHGTLHLLGYDHMDEAEAEAMETLETQVLAGLAIANPYAQPDV